MNNDLFSLAGKVALVTGANTGIGQGIAVALAQAGADVVAVGRTAPSETAAAVQALGRRFHFIHADLSSIKPIESVWTEAQSVMGSVDVLINNAGTIRRSAVVDFSESDWDLVMDTNLKSVFFMCQAFARRAINENRPGKIINIASMLSFQGGIRVASYTSSKSGVAGLTKLLANELAPHGINVNAIAPGYIETNNTEALRNDPKRQQEILARIPTGRWGTPGDLGGAAVFLASGASDYVQGTVLPVDGGWLAR